MVTMKANQEARAGLPDSIEIVLPPGWIDVPLDRAEQKRFVESVLRAVEDDDGGMSTQDRRQLELVVSQMGALARAQNVLVASAYIAPGSGIEDDVGVIVAGLVVTAVDRRSLKTDVPLVGEVLLTGLSSIDHSVDGREYDEIEPPSLTEVNGVECVRLRRLARLRDSQQRELKQFEQSFLVPVALGDGLVILQFSTVNFEYAKQFSELFEKIAGTLRILYPDDPTFEDDPNDTEAGPGSEETVG